MALAEGQVQVRDLVMGRGTVYRMLEFNPWTRQARADQGDARAWADGVWSGAEWGDQATVPMRIRVGGTDAASWLAAHQALAAAFAPSSDDIELRWVTGGVEYMLRGRPRLVDPEIKAIGTGAVMTKAAFAALDPTIYSGDEHSVVLGLPSVSGGLTLPFTLPFTLPATVTSGQATLTNAGKKAVGLVLRVDGPVSQPRISLLTGSTTVTLRLWLDLASGEWLDIDTAARTVYLQGTASRRGQATDGWPVLAPGSSALSWNADAYNLDARLTVTWRDAWY